MGNEFELQLFGCEELEMQHGHWGRMVVIGIYLCRSGLPSDPAKKVSRPFD
jgi:hypothetical protein